PLTATPAMSTLSLHDALPIYRCDHQGGVLPTLGRTGGSRFGGFRGSRALRHGRVRCEQRGGQGSEQRGSADHVPALPEVRRTPRSEEHTSELQSREKLVCRLL